MDPTCRHTYHYQQYKLLGEHGKQKESSMKHLCIRTLINGEPYDLVECDPQETWYDNKRIAHSTHPTHTVKDSANLWWIPAKK